VSDVGAHRTGSPSRHSNQTSPVAAGVTASVSVDPTWVSPETEGVDASAASALGIRRAPTSMSTIENSPSAAARSQWRRAPRLASAPTRLRSEDALFLNLLDCLMFAPLDHFPEYVCKDGT
jgi:hypothetical protein